MGERELTGAELVRRAIALQPLVRQHAAEAERERRLPRELARAMADAGLFRVAVPRSLGGAEAHPFEQIRVIEAISEADGAAGWTLMIGIETLGMSSAVIRREVAEEVILGNPSVIFAGALNPMGRAQPVPGGMRVSGRWPFASGCTHADWFYGQSVVYDGDAPARAPGGGPLLREMLIPAKDFRVLDTWHVGGLRGSGSHDVLVEDVFVPDRFVTNAAETGIHEDGPLFRLPPFTRLAYNKVGVATGIARAAIDHLVALAAQKKPRGSTLPLAERPHAQRCVAEAETALRSARAFVFEAVGEVWDVTVAGERATKRQRALAQLACSNAVAASASAVERVCSAAGTTANFTASPLERALRDVRVVPQHIMVSPQLADAAARVLIGLESETPFF
jgi:alkylation response protein AidB-like acyl-CoA dehydrogenase